jgi:2-oxoglutarate dehydrogenase E2 component (dihydrolipoamide succinyltransferase)
MAIIDLVMPKMGESIMEATILKWHKQPGELVRQDETLLDIATDKVDSEVPSTAAGRLKEILFQVNDVVPVGAVIARIQTEQPDPNAFAGPGNTPTETERSVSSDGPEPGFRAAPKNIISPVSPVHSSNGSGNSNRFYSPLVLTIASNEGISMQELEKLPGSGNEGRVTKKDILQYVEDRKQGRPTSARAATVTQGPDAYQRPSIPEISRPVAEFAGNNEILEMDRMRKLIAEHMLRSKQTSAHVTSFTEADVTNMVRWREQTKGDFEKREGTKITYTPLFIEAIVKCIRKFPMINSSVDGDRIIIRKDINMGMATALPNGNLIVPVIRNADQFNLVGLTKQVNTMAENARNNRLRPEDTQGGSFTMTNVGVFGSLMGTPIINQPQVAILALGAIKKRPMVMEGPDGDSIAIRHMMYLSLSYDHRIIDGSLGASFLTEVARTLENFSMDKAY